VDAGSIIFGVIIAIVVVVSSYNIAHNIIRKKQRNLINILWLAPLLAAIPGVIWMILAYVTYRPSGFFSFGRMFEVMLVLFFVTVPGVAFTFITAVIIYLTKRNKG